MNKYGTQPPFRRWEDRPLHARQWLIHQHGSARFLRGVLRECPGIEPSASRGDQVVIWAVLVLFGVCIAWGLL